HPPPPTNIYTFSSSATLPPRYLHSFPTRRSSDLFTQRGEVLVRVTREAETDTTAMVRFAVQDTGVGIPGDALSLIFNAFTQADRSEEHTSELQSLRHLVCRLLLEKKKKKKHIRRR